MKRGAVLFGHEFGELPGKLVGVLTASETGAALLPLEAVLVNAGRHLGDRRRHADRPARRRLCSARLRARCAECRASFGLVATFGTHTASRRHSARCGARRDRILLTGGP